MNPPTALIAEDEALMRERVKEKLAAVWPELAVVAEAEDGDEALALFAAHRPQIAFLDIRMPGRSGLDVAAAIGAQCHVVFITAYDQYALQAFDAQAVDYLLKPVQPSRLQKTVEKLKKAIADRPPAAIETEATLEPVLARLRGLLAAEGGHAAPRLGAIAASLPGALGASIRMVPIDEVAYFEAADKYLRVLTAGAEYLIRTPLKELLAQLDPQVFWQIHRGTVVRASLIDTVTRDEAGKLSLSLRGRPERLAVSRLYAHQIGRAHV